MWDYKKNLIYPVNIKNKNPQLAKFILAQYGGAYCKCLSRLPCLKGAVSEAD